MSKVVQVYEFQLNDLNRTLVSEYYYIFFNYSQCHDKFNNYNNLNIYKTCKVVPIKIHYTKLKN